MSKTGCSVLVDMLIFDPAQHDVRIMSGEEIQIKKILFAIDGSDPSLKAAKYAVRIAKFERASIICIHVIRKPQYLADHPQEPSLLSYYELGKKLAGAWFRKAIELASKEGIYNQGKLIRRTLQDSFNKCV
jgi:nucleotide-binding universal stress UspA family protein